MVDAARVSDDDCCEKDQRERREEPWGAGDSELRRKRNTQDRHGDNGQCHWPPWLGLPVCLPWTIAGCARLAVIYRHAGSLQDRQGRIHILSGSFMPAGRQELWIDEHGTADTAMNSVMLGRR